MFNPSVFDQGNVHFMRKIPQGAEASNILVGEVDFLEKPLSAFVRLSHSVFLGDLTEVPVPTRFLFVLLGPMVRFCIDACPQSFNISIYFTNREELVDIMKWEERWPPLCQMKYFTMWRTRPETVATCWLEWMNS